MPTSTRPGLESADAEEARTDGTGTDARANRSDGARCHETNVGDPADAARAEEEIEVTPEMIEAGIGELRLSVGLDGCSDPKPCVPSMWL